MELDETDEQQRDAAFRALAERFRGTAFQWAVDVLDDAQAAEDAAQEALIIAYQQIDQLRETKAFPAWLKRIVISQCARQTRRRHMSDAPLDDDAAPDPVDHLEAHDQQEIIQRALRELPEHERTVTILFYLGGYSQQEIADAIGVPLTTVKKRLQYAREHLRETLAPQIFAALDVQFGQAASELPAVGVWGMLTPVWSLHDEDENETLAVQYPLQRIMSVLS